jgi:hypothetical protein
MNGRIAEEVHSWFAENVLRLAQAFPILRYHAFETTGIQGKISIQVDGPAVAASVTFWNKGDVEALVLDKATHTNYPMDDRKLQVNEDVNLLLRSYFDKATAIMKTGSGPKG